MKKIRLKKLPIFIIIFFIIIIIVLFNYQDVKEQYLFEQEIKLLENNDFSNIDNMKTEKYIEIEEAIKKYYVDYNNLKKDFMKYDAISLLNVINQEHLINKDFDSIIEEYYSKFLEKKLLLEDMLKEEKILSYLNSSDNKIIKKYQDIMITNDNKIIEEKLKECFQSNEEKYDYVKKMMNILKENDCWHVEDNNLLIMNQDLLEEYNSYIKKIIEE